jgi:hypothetical protein
MMSMMGLGSFETCGLLLEALDGRRRYCRSASSETAFSVLYL